MKEEKKDIDPNESGSAHVTHMSDIPQVNSDADGPRTVEQYSRREDKVGGVRLQVLNILMIVAFGILSLYLLFGTFRTNEGYTEMRTATDKYIVCQQAASDMQAASDFLTDQVRTFAVTGDREAVARYFEEVNVTKRRDNALSSMHEYLSDSDAESHLADALKYSTELMDREYYAMAVTAYARGYDLNDFPEAVRSVDVPEAVIGLPAAEQSQMARNLVFDEVYQDYKRKITESTDKCIGELVDSTRLQQLSAADSLLSILRSQHIVIGLLLVLSLSIVFLTTFLLIRPLSSCVGHIRQKQPLPMDGAYELRFLAQTYNTMFDQVMRTQEALSYEASHDALTGLFNRSFFDSIRKKMDESSIAMILIDVDKFKTVNDTYGHSTGDHVLISVAEILRGSFRTEDYVCRIGGDEFAVIMVHADSNLRGLLMSKIAAANAKLAHPADGLPVVSLSVGVAFGDRENPGEDIFKDADKALYRVKEGGRCGIDFY